MAPFDRRLRSLAAALRSANAPAPAAAATPAEEPEPHATPPGPALYEHLEREGFAVVRDCLSAEMVARLRDATDLLIDEERKNDGPYSSRHLFRSQGSMISVPGHRVDPAEKVVLPTVDPVFLELISWQPALDALVQLGWPAGGATFTDGYIISKPPHSPPLFWHCAQPPLCPFLAPHVLRADHRVLQTIGSAGRSMWTMHHARRSCSSCTTCTTPRWRTAGKCSRSLCVFFRRSS